ncbi:MAG TPA: hypothetical protein VGO50_01280 [Pyrinomonadaceae bacterium]|jgi:hypothetical protein|nr:hypothetical protein [Pyrinomonadaceae bacterium]
MNEQHIIENLDARPLAEFSGEEISRMQAHSAECADCGIAFRAAQRSAAILKFEAERIFEPSPFFHAKVAAALKEKRSSLRPVLDLWKMWQASGALVSAMVAMVAVLFFAGAVAPNASGNMAPMAYTADTAEAVIFEQDNTLKDITSEQIFQEIYER